MEDGAIKWIDRAINRTERAIKAVYRANNANECAITLEDRAIRMIELGFI